MPGTASISGLMSGLKTDEIIDKMLEFGRRPINLLKSRESGYEAKLKAWQDANTRLLSLKAKAEGLTLPSAFQAKSVAVSDESALSASVYTAAAPGTYSLTINKLAQVEQRQSVEGYADVNSTTVGTGTITVGAGSSAKEIVIDSTNNTLGGLRDAINRADVGVTATIVDLGSMSSHDYHLVLTGNTTGADNAITWTPNLAGGTAPTWNLLQSAQNSEVVIGSGANATTITKSTNTLTDMFAGMTLTLKEADPAKVIKVTVTPDPSQIKQKIQDFVTEYNSLIDFLNKQFSFNADTKETGTLFGDYTLQNIQQDLRSRVLAVVPGLPATANTLSQIGFSSDTKDHLVLDEIKLDAALANNAEGVMKLFASFGETTDYAVTFVSAGSLTKDTGTSGAYTVRVDQVAMQARITAGVAQTEVLGADETLTINGTDIHLTAGMTAQQVVDAINSKSTETGVEAVRTGADGTGSGSYLTLRRVAYGSSGRITAVSSVSNAGGGNSSGLGTVQVTESSFAGESGTGTGNAGADVAGAFGVTVNGVTTWEAATGTGQLLTGNSGNANTDGLKVRVTALTTGEHGQVTLTRGAASLLDNLISFTTGAKGSVTGAQDTLNKQIADLKDEIQSKEDWLTRYEDKLRQQFSDLEGTLGQLQSQGAYLSSQFAAMNAKK